MAVMVGFQHFPRLSTPSGIDSVTGVPLPMMLLLIFYLLLHVAVTATTAAVAAVSAAALRTSVPRCTR